MNQHRMRQISAGSILLFVAVLLLPAVSGFAQYGMYVEPPRPEPAVRPPVQEPTPTPTPAVGRLAIDVRMPDGAVVAPGERLRLEVRVSASGVTPKQVSVVGMTLDDRAGDVSPAVDFLSGPGLWRTYFHAGEVPGSWQLLFIARDPDGRAKPATAVVTVHVSSTEPVLVTASGRVIHAMPDTKELHLRNNSWRNRVWLRGFMARDRVGRLARRLETDREYKELVADAVRLDRRHIALTGHWPPKNEFRSHAHLESLMSRYWADSGITISAATANELGNVLIAWKRGSTPVVTLSEDLARSLGVGTRVIKVGNVFNEVGAAMILFDFWNNMTSAETPAEAREAWYKAGYASLDLYLANVVADTFGAATALPQMFVSYILTNSYDTLIGGYKKCWFKKMVEVAAAEDWLGDGPGDTRAVDKVKAAMKGPGGLKGALMKWWADEAYNWAGWMGGCGNWDLAEARGYREAFVDRLMRTAEVEAGGRVYHPWSFYYTVSMMLVRDAQHERALEIARGLIELDAAWMERLREIRVEGRFTVRRGDASGPPVRGAAVAPDEWHLDEGWTTGDAGTVTVRLRKFDLSPWDTLLLAVKVPEGKVYYFVVPPDAMVEVAP